MNVSPTMSREVHSQSPIHQSSDRISSFKVQRVALQILASISGASTIGVLILAGASVLAPVSAVCSIALAATTVGLTYWASTIRDYKNPEELDRIRREAIGLSYDQLLKAHSIDHIVEYSIVSKDILQDKFYEEISGLSYSKMVAKYPLATIESFGLLSTEFLANKLWEEIQHYSYASMIEMSESHRTYGLMRRIRDRFANDIRYAVSYSQIHNLASPELIAKHQLMPMRQVITAFEQEARYLSYADMLRLENLATIIKHDLIPLEAIRAKFQESVQFLSYEGMIKQENLATIVKYDLVPIERVRFKFQQMAAFKPYQELVRLAPLHTIIKYNLCPIEELRFKFSLMSAQMSYRQLIAIETLDAMTRYQLLPIESLRLKLEHELPKIKLDSLTSRRSEVNSWYQHSLISPYMYGQLTQILDQYASFQHESRYFNYARLDEKYPRRTECVMARLERQEKEIERKYSSKREALIAAGDVQQLADVAETHRISIQEIHQRMVQTAKCPAARAEQLAYDRAYTEAINGFPDKRRSLESRYQSLMTFY